VSEMDLHDCLIDMSGTMLGSMPEVVQKAETPSFTTIIIIIITSYWELYTTWH